MEKFAWIYFFGFCAVVSRASVQADTVEGPEFVTCARQFTKQGCYNSKKTGMVLLINDRDGKGRELKWDKFAQSIHSLACRCSAKAKADGYAFFGIRYYAECWASKDSLAAFLKSSIKTEKCSDPEFNKCNITERRECVGKADTEYIYSFGNKKLGGNSACTELDKCVDGEGDCDFHSQCASGLNCGVNNCDQSVSSFSKNDDCCYKPNKYGGNSACTELNLCSAGQGDCDYHSQCQSGLNCGSNNCDRRISSFSKTDDCCYKPNKLGGNSACTTSNLCGAGEGDCDYHSQCAIGLNCGSNNCDRRISSFSKTDDCCYKPNKYGGNSACTRRNPCSAGQGDCDNHYQCAIGLNCGSNNCDRRISSFSKTDDCCYKPNKYGGNSACTKRNPCSAGQGDCDKHYQCAGDLKCGINNCDQKISSFSKNDDCCYKPNK